MYALVDCNNFYCSCERVFNPALDGQPVIVLSNNDGCAIARSEEAKALGVKMGTPYFMVDALVKQHKMHVFSSNYTLYQDMSDRVMSILKDFVPGIEVYSIDEAFLDMHGLPHHDLLQLAVNIRRRVKQFTGIPVSIGIAPTKTLAKMANRYAKKKCREEGVFYAATEALVTQMLEFTQLEDVWGIGRQHTKFLASHGFVTAADFAGAPEAWVRKEMSVVGLRLLQELRGIPCVQWEFERAAKKNIGTARSFGHLTTSKKEVEEALADYTANCARKLRQEGSCTAEIYVFLYTNPHKAHRDAQYRAGITLQLPVPTNNTTELVRHALRGLNIIYRDGYRYMKCGIDTMKLVPESNVQQNLFEPAHEKRGGALMKAMDAINSCMGKDAVKLAVQNFRKTYKMRQAYLSKRYTTRMDEILSIRY